MSLDKEDKELIGKLFCIGALCTAVVAGLLFGAVGFFSTVAAWCFFLVFIGVAAQ